MGGGGVGGLQIAVDDPEVVDVLHGTDDLLEEPSRADPKGGGEGSRKRTAGWVREGGG